MSTYFDVRLPHDPRRALVWQEIVRYLSPWLKGATAVLEIGAGYGTFINAIVAPRRVAIDQDPVISAYAAPEVETRVMDATRLSEISDVFDIVLVSNFFEHLTDEQFESLIPLIKQRLVPAGKLIVIQPNFRYAFREYFDDYTHKRIFTDEGLAGALRAHGFRVIHSEPRFLPFSLKQSPSALPKSLLKFLIRLYLHLPWRPRAGQLLLVVQKV